ncbi:MAG: helicase, partial [Thermoleophilia bacterium]|nr:helicase [Thermoleophilia bacterium]
MLVLHAALTADGDLLAWAQHADGGGEDDGAGVSGAIDAIVTTGRARPIELLEGTLLREGELVQAQVATVRLDPGEAIELIAACEPGLRLPAPGVRPGAEFAALGALLRIAGATVLRQELLPSVRWTGEGRRSLAACWEPIPGPHLRDALDATSRALPDVVRAFGAEAAPMSRLALAFVGRIVDALVRARLLDAPVEIETRPADSLHDRWLDALCSSTDARIEGPTDALDRLREEVGQWQRRLRRSSAAPFRLCMRLEEPYDPSEDGTGDAWTLRFLLQLREDPSVLVDASEAWETTGPRRELLARHGFHAGEHLLAPLGEAAHAFEPIADALRAGTPSSCELDTAGAHELLARVAPLLESLGVAVFIPAWWRGRDGRWQASVRAEVRTELTGGRRTLDALNLATLVEYDWRLALGEATLTRDELTRLAAQKSGLVRIRGHWVELDAAELRAAIAHLERLEADPATPARGGGAGRTAPLGRLLSTPGAAVVDTAGVDMAEVLARAAQEQPLADVEVPAGLTATLRPYQHRGYGWLATMSRLGLGACLADDMGLGKTVQALAAIQLAWEEAAPDGRRPTLLVCPTSVLTNWLRETERFTPDLPAIVHHGSGRSRGEEFVASARDAGLVITSYALLARDIDDLQAVAWHCVVLDEAQNIKNPGTRHAVAARSLQASSRMALTGTPIENHVGDLWSIMEFLGPGLLGTQADFRRRYLLPIQSGSFPEAAARLRRLTSPFIMRRTKSDPDVAPDLPDRLESIAYCSLTTEQVTLYEAIVRDAEKTLRMSVDDARRSGIERRGTILATISRLKQACNHPAQLLGDNSRVAGRSGKLARLEELTETILEQGERAL